MEPPLNPFCWVYHQKGSTPKRVPTRLDSQFAAVSEGPRPEGSRLVFRAVWPGPAAHLHSAFAAHEPSAAAGDLEPADGPDGHRHGETLGSHRQTGVARLLVPPSSSG